MAKKNFTKAVDNAADIFFKKAADEKQGSNDDNVANITNDTKHTHDTYIENDLYDVNVVKHTHVTNKSKHYDDRGKRGERYGILLDKQLKEDLRKLANATGSRSVNDLIVTILLNYIDAPEQQETLSAFNNLTDGNR